MIDIKEINYKNFGKCLEISNGTVSLVVTLDFGPRIIRYSFVDGKNIMFEDKERQFFENSPSMEKVYGQGATWKIYGGHRIWTSPEDMVRTYYPDNEPVSYKITDTGAILTSPVQRWTKYGFSFKIDLADTGTNVTIEHSMTNYGEEKAELALWPITVLAPGGVEIVPQPTKKTGCAPRTKLGFWDYVKMTDKRLVWLDEYIILRHDSDTDEKMKFGINSEHGYAMYFNKDELFVKKFNVNPEGNYPDGGLSFETFTNNLFLEMESLGETKTVFPEETITHTEYWALFKAKIPELTDEGIKGMIRELEI